MRVLRLGPAISAVSLFLVVATASLVFTKWLALASILVICMAWRGARLARRDPENFGGFKTSLATLTVTFLIGASVGGYYIAHIPEFLAKREMRQKAATQAAMYHLWNQLEDYKSRFGSYPPNVDSLRKVSVASVPADYWEKALKYRSFTEAIADASPDGSRMSGIPFNNFELRSAGPDGKMGTADDIVMRDGIVYSGSDLKRELGLGNSIDR